jgi:addiction module HigA family antidote
MIVTRLKTSQSAPIHPGEMLRIEFLVPLSLTANALALALRVPSTRISEIVNQRRGITADTAYRLSLYFGTTPDFWMNLQTTYELHLLQVTCSKQIKREVKPRKMQAPNPEND